MTVIYIQQRAGEFARVEERHCPLLIAPLPAILFSGDRRLLLALLLCLPVGSFPSLVIWWPPNFFQREKNIVLTR